MERKFKTKSHQIWCDEAFENYAPKRELKSEAGKAFWAKYNVLKDAPEALLEPSYYLLFNWNADAHLVKSIWRMGGQVSIPQTPPALREKKALAVLEKLIKANLTVDNFNYAIKNIMTFENESLLNNATISILKNNPKVFRPSGLGYITGADLACKLSPAELNLFIAVRTFTWDRNLLVSTEEALELMKIKDLETIKALVQEFIDASNAADKASRGVKISLMQYLKSEDKAKFIEEQVDAHRNRIIYDDGDSMFNTYSKYE